MLSRDNCPCDAHLDVVVGCSVGLLIDTRDMILKAFKAGAKGWCTAAPNLLPQPCLDLYAAAQAGDWTKAEAIYTELKSFLEFIVAGGLPTTVKGGLDLLGRGVGVPRLPLLPLDAAGRAELGRLLKTA